MLNKKLQTHQITPDMIPEFIRYLYMEERSRNTITKYVRYVQEFIDWAEDTAAATSAGAAATSVSASAAATSISQSNAATSVSPTAAATSISSSAEVFPAWLDNVPKPTADGAAAAAASAGGVSITKFTVIAWKEFLKKNNKYAPATINARIASVNAFFRFMEWGDCHVKSLKLQRPAFRNPKRELTKKEYMRLIKTAYKNNNIRLVLVMETICGTGIRVSELKYITVEAVEDGHTTIMLKGKVRTIILPNRLCKKLKQYINDNNIASGEIFLTRSGKSMSRGQIWTEMKEICKAAGVEESKVFPHNLRHLFARSFYNIHHDIVKLADMMGHSSVETTRLYLISTGAEHAKLIESLGLVS